MQALTEPDQQDAYAKLRDDMIHAIGQTLSFYGKTLGKPDVPFWMQAFRGKDWDTIKRCLVLYTQQGRYAPKPVDILDLYDTEVERRRGRDDTRRSPLTNSCPEHIATAWRWFINRCTAGSRNVPEPLFSDDQDIDQKTQEAYLLIVNQEARRLNEPEAIPDQYKLPEVWHEPTRNN